MAEHRQHFSRRWPHLTTLYNSSPFINRSYKEVEEWNSLRPLPGPIGGYPPSYDDTYRGESVFEAYNPQRQYSIDKYGRNFIGVPSNYDAFSTSTYQTLPKKKKKPFNIKNLLLVAIGLSLLLALIGAVTAIVLVLIGEANCVAYGDSVWVLSSPYNHDKITTDAEVNQNFITQFCVEMQEAFEQYFEEDHVCGCSTGDINLVNGLPLVSFSIGYRKINEVDNNETYVGMRLATVLHSVINETELPSFRLSYIIPPEFAVTKSPMPSSGNETLSYNGTIIARPSENGAVDLNGTDDSTSNSSSNAEDTLGKSSGEVELTNASTKPTTTLSSTTTTASPQTSALQTTAEQTTTPAPPSAGAPETTTTPPAPTPTTTTASPTTAIPTTERPIQQAPPVTAESLPALPTTNDIETTTDVRVTEAPVTPRRQNVAPPPAPPGAFLADPIDPGASVPAGPTDTQSPPESTTAV